jgi:tRNA(Arg) A34 adenosine deaminase TadA
MDDRRGMHLALQQAAAAARRGDPGFGAIVALGDKVIAAASSTEVSGRDPLAHDGITVVREACRRLMQATLSDCTYFGTVEPCPMCSAALLQARIGRIVIGANGDELERILGPRTIRLEDLTVDYGHRPVIDRGVCSELGLQALARSLGHRTT